MIDVSCQHLLICLDFCTCEWNNHTLGKTTSLESLGGSQLGLWHWPLGLGHTVNVWIAMAHSIDIISLCGNNNIVRKFFVVFVVVAVVVRVLLCVRKFISRFSFHGGVVYK